MPEFRFKESFKHKERFCMIIEREKKFSDMLSDPLGFMSSILFNNDFTITFCAYIESKEVPGLSPHNFHPKSEFSENVSFVGKHNVEWVDDKFKDIFWIGFDTGLKGETAETNIIGSVRERVKTLCEELIERGY